MKIRMEPTGDFDVLSSDCLVPDVSLISQGDYEFLFRERRPDWRYLRTTQWRREWTPAVNRPICPQSGTRGLVGRLRIQVGDLTVAMTKSRNARVFGGR